jgi:hypothetical protein
MDKYPPIPLSVAQCKDLLRTVAKMLCVKAELVSTRLLSAEDKQDMIDGLITLDVLATHVKVWKENKMPDYTKGTGELYKASNNLPMGRYRGIG